MCKYSIIGCDWEGPVSNQENHEESCICPSKTGASLMDAINKKNEKQKEELSQQKVLIKMLSYEKISICGE